MIIVEFGHGIPEIPGFPTHRHPVPPTKPGGVPKKEWSEVSVEDPTPNKIGSKSTTWTLCAFSTNGLAAIKEYIARIPVLNRPRIVDSRPSFLNALFVAQLAADDDATPSAGLPFGAQRGVPHCRSHPKQAVEAFRKLDELYEQARSERPKRVADVFDDDSAQRFLQVCREGLSSIISDFKSAIAEEPALVIGIAADEEEADLPAA